MKKHKQQQEAEAASKAAVSWPVHSAGELTVDHVPEAVRARIIAGERQRSHRLARALMSQVEARNDTIRALDGALRGANKDTALLNAALAGGIGSDLVELGVLKGPEKREGGQ